MYKYSRNIVQKKQRYINSSPIPARLLKNSHQQNRFYQKNKNNEKNTLFLLQQKHNQEIEQKNTTYPMQTEEKTTTTTKTIVEKNEVIVCHSDGSMCFYITLRQFRKSITRTFQIWLQQLQMLIAV